MKNDTARYIRFILNEDIIAYNPKANKTKKAAAKPKEEKLDTPDLIDEILKLGNTLVSDK